MYLPQLTKIVEKVLCWAHRAPGNTELGTGGSRARTPAPAQSLSESCSLGTNANRWPVAVAPPGSRRSEPCIVRGPGLSSPAGAHSGRPGFSQTGDWGQRGPPTGFGAGSPASSSFSPVPGPSKASAPVRRDIRVGLRRGPSAGEGSLQEGPQGGSWAEDSPATKDTPVCSKEGLSPGKDESGLEAGLPFITPETAQYSQGHRCLPLRGAPAGGAGRGLSAGQGHLRPSQ